jgi:hypothetical protein
MHGGEGGASRGWKGERVTSRHADEAGEVAAADGPAGGGARGPGDWQFESEAEVGRKLRAAGYLAES